MNFDPMFEQLTGNKPFPWQKALYKLFAKGEIPASCSLPTGLGKTSIIAIWLIALASGAKVPRRLVYVVNRRTVVDQTTDEVEMYQDKIMHCREMQEPLWNLWCDDSAIPGKSQPLAVSTLRGQHADNRDWSENPARPAVICGTVDMIGSRILFSGYGIGARAKPLHAGFLGQDVFLVHDEAHLEPAFQRLIESIKIEQERCREFGKFHVMELTATSRGTGNVFTLTLEDLQNKIVNQRVNAAKRLFLHALADAKKLDKELVEKALTFKESGKAVLVFATSVNTVLEVQKELAKAKVPVKTLTGTMRGHERDALVNDPIFQRFLPNPPENATKGTVYLVCTSAGEVGVNISADHLICDLSTFESMAQRLGRVNRFGKFPGCEVHVYYPTTWDGKDPLTVPRQKTVSLLQQLVGKDVSPEALGAIPADDRKEGFAPEPTYLPVTDILFDAWALTSIRDKLPGRPHVEPYLHGIKDWEPPDTHFAWREELEAIPSQMLVEYTPSRLLELYPLRPQELLRVPSYYAIKQLEIMARRHPEKVVWLVDDDGTVAEWSLENLISKDNKDQVNGKTIVLPPIVGGLKEGMLDGTSADPVNEVSEHEDRLRYWNEPSEQQKERLKKMRRCLRVVFDSEEDEESEPSKVWHWFVARNEGDTSSKAPVLWEVHVGDVERETAAIVRHLPLEQPIKNAILLAAKYHDHGKKRKLFQAALGNRDPNIWLAKSGKASKSRIEEKYRHEFGSLLDLQKKFPKELLQLDGELQELVLHLIGAHHGRARPHFALDEVFDPDYSQMDADDLAMSVPRRFARLQRKYGRWGLAYLESLLRAADWAASANPSKMVDES